MAWVNLAASALVTDQPTQLNGLVLNAAVSGSVVTLYDGRDATTGRKIGAFNGLANVTNNLLFLPPLPCPNGLYVVVGSNVSEVLVNFGPE